MNNLTLAITTIGDLLLKNKRSRDKDGKPIDNINLNTTVHENLLTIS